MGEEQAGRAVAGTENHPREDRLAVHACRSSSIIRGEVTLHTFTSPDFGEGVNNHVIETRHERIVIDVPLYRPYAAAFLSYLRGLGKPIERILLSYAHPDHWLSLMHFPGIPSVAYPEVIAEMVVLRDRALSYHQSIHPELAPTAVAMPSAPPPWRWSCPLAARSSPRIWFMPACTVSWRTRTLPVAIRLAIGYSTSKSSKPATMRWFCPATE